MLKLMKYELHKTFFSKIVLLVITAIAEVVFLAGVFLKSDSALAWGTVGLVLCGAVGIIVIGLESLVIFHRDLNTKQSYMLFLTPRSSYEILLAKLLENAISIFAAGLFFILVTAVDVSVAVLYIGGLEAFLDMIQSLALTFADIQVDWEEYAREAAVGFVTLLASWVAVLAMGNLAIVLSSSILNGKKFHGFISFALFLAVSWIFSALEGAVIPQGLDLYVEYGLRIVYALAVTGILYAVTGWFMEKKLSV